MPRIEQISYPSPRGLPAEAPRTGAAILRATVAQGDLTKLLAASGLTA
jgi:hypothetical protein